MKFSSVDKLKTIIGFVKKIISSYLTCKKNIKKKKKTSKWPKYDLFVIIILIIIIIKTNIDFKPYFFMK